MPITSTQQRPNPFGGKKLVVPQTLFAVAVTSLTSSGTTATCVTATPHGKTTGQSVTIREAEQADYNGTFTVTVTNATTFTYTITQQIAAPDVDTATGTIWAQITSAAQISYADAYDGGQRVVFIAVGWWAGLTLTFTGLDDDYPMPCFFLNYGGDTVDVTAGESATITVAAGALKELYIAPSSGIILEI